MKQVVIVHEIPSVIVTAIAEQGIPGPRGPQGIPGIGSVIAKSTVTANQNELITIDGSQEELLTRSIKWILTFEDIVGNKFRTSEVLALRQNGTVDYTEYGVIGSRFMVNFDIIIEGGFIKLVATNNEPNQVKITAVIISVA